MLDSKTLFVSSTRLAEVLGIKATQVRKDMTYLGAIGKRGVGYHVLTLRTKLRETLGLTSQRKVIIVGAGNLGQALIGHGPFQGDDFQIVAGFDIASRVVGRVIDGVKILDLAELNKLVRRLRVSVALLAVPPDQAQTVTDLIVAAGIEGVLNLSPVHVKAPRGVTVRNVDVAEQLHVLTFRMQRTAKLSAAQTEKY